MSEGNFKATRNSKKKSSGRERAIEKQQPSIERGAMLEEVVLGVGEIK